MLTGKNRATRQSAGGQAWLSIVAEILKEEDIFTQMIQDSDYCFDNSVHASQILNWFQTLMCSVELLREIQSNCTNIARGEKQKKEIQEKLDKYQNETVPDFLIDTESVDYNGAGIGISMTQYRIS